MCVFKRRKNKNSMSKHKQLLKALNFKPNPELLIEPTTEARLKFIAEFVPRWMAMFRSDWETAHRLAEEIDENFQFVDDDQPVGLHDGELRKDVSLAYIIVCQQLEILRLKSLMPAHKKKVQEQVAIE